MTTKLLRSTFFITATLLLLGACNTKQEKSNSENSEAEKVPSFEVTTVSGDTISLDESLQEGKPVVIYFTASWCPICAQNWPVLTEVYPEYEDRLTLVAIGIDPTDDEETMRELAEEKGFTFPVTRGLPNIMLDYGVESQATTVGVNRDGEIAFRKNKMALSADEYRTLFDELLN
ncbi:peroxiredoxin family protein [Gracilimonas sp.]|uniref:peroxiredoxin family protein n=1 Tax=Gracilimonas sp. TaxID=1974203 RepID=UPI0028728E0F|nr:redoxin domain-containing protein [Gracilimonas sp.]